MEWLLAIFVAHDNIDRLCDNGRLQSGNYRADYFDCLGRTLLQRRRDFVDRIRAYRVVSQYHAFFQRR